MAAVLAFLTFALAGCFEDPVTERVQITLTEDDYAEVVHEVRFSDQGDGKKNLIERLSALRDEYLRQQDHWSRAFSATSPEFETLEWEKIQGKLSKSRRSAVIKAPALDDLFTQLGIVVAVLEDPEWQEVSVYPGTRVMATREQQQQVSSTFGQWAEEVAAYVDAMRAVYDYVDANPDRAAACLRPLFSDVLPEADRESREELRDGEKELVDRAHASMDRVNRVVTVDPDQAFSLNELSLLVFDPLGYDLSITCGGDILNEAGFSARRERTVTHLGRNLWTAFEALEGKWLAPDPLLMSVRRGRSGDDTTIPLEHIVGQRRFAVRSIATTAVRAALEKELRPPELLRVRCARPAAELAKAHLGADQD